MPSIDHHVSGSQYWRSLEHLAETPEIREQIGKEFPGYDVDGLLAGSRRGFLKLMGASMALAGVTLTGCRRWPEEKLAPYSSNPRGRTPGVPEQYATAWELGGVATGLLVTSFDGRPIKAEGNPSHPFSKTIEGRAGSADAFAQASLLEMYDPQRSRTVVDHSTPVPKETEWPVFAAAVERHFAKLRGAGEGLAVLCEASAGPSVQYMRKGFAAAFPQAKWYEYEPLSWDAEAEGAKLAFGKRLRPRLHLESASTIVLLDADILGTHPAHVRYASDWASRRRTADDGTMSRVYIAESGFSLTGSVADVRVGVDPARIDVIARALAARLGVAGVPVSSPLSDIETSFVTSAAEDLKAAGPAGVITAGPSAAPAIHALCYAINAKIGALGKTMVLLNDPSLDRATHLDAIAALASDMASGKVKTLLILGGNPVYDAPADVKFETALAQVPLSIHLSHYLNETSLLSTWHVPRAHYLEAWGDARAWDGTAGIIQPLIEPLYGGKSIVEMLALVNGDSLKDGELIVRRTWTHLIPAANFERDYRRVLEAGVMAGTGYAPATAAMTATDYPAPAPASQSGFTLRLEQDSRVYDGRFANNGWLQETADPLTKLVWDNAVLVAKKDADGLGITTNDILHLDLPGGAGLDVPAYVMPGQPLGVLSLSLGYGRTAAGHIGNGVGTNAYPLRTTKAPFLVAGVKAQPAGGSSVLAMTQAHHIMDPVGAAARDHRVGPKYESGAIIHEAAFAEYKENHAAANGGRVVNLQLFNPPHTLRDTHAWGMAIDLSTCIGCNSCAVACQAENNIPIVGKEQVFRHREMNWIRIDRYFKGDVEDPNIEVVYQPVTCQHCENAPCEQVCPVGATVHDTEGINTMVYNRCIGTRYCSNNCPYKVRRFNYFDYHSQDPRQVWGKPWPLLPDQQQLEQVDKIKRMVFNPDVTVRMRGVMEKCTFCVQRIHGAVIAKRNVGEDIADGDIMTACQQACPTQAIVFGNLNDPGSAVSKLHKNARAYGLLDEELNTRPRNQYLAKLRNPAGPSEKTNA